MCLLGIQREPCPRCDESSGNGSFFEYSGARAVYP
jgi:hypothetical protein